MPQIASEAAAPTVNYARANPTRPNRAAEKAPATPFERMLDDTAAATDQDTDTPSSTKTGSAGTAQKAESQSESKANKTKKPAKSASGKGKTESKPDQTAPSDQKPDSNVDSAKSAEAAQAAAKVGEQAKADKAVEADKDSKDAKSTKAGKDSAADAGSAAATLAQSKPVAGLAAIVIPVDSSKGGQQAEAQTVAGTGDHKGGKSAASAQVATLLRAGADTPAKADNGAATPGNAAAAGKAADSAQTPDQTGTPGAPASTNDGPAADLLGDKKPAAPGLDKSAGTKGTDNNPALQPDAAKIGSNGLQPTMPTAPAAQSTTAQQTALGATPSAPAAVVPIAGVAVEIAGRALSGKNHFEIRLDPPELGRVEVHLDVSHDGRITTHVVADRSDTLALLQRDASGLQRALQDAGLKTADNGLQFSLRDQTADQQQQQQSNAGTATPRAGDNDKVAAVGISPAALARYAAHAGGLDIRV